MSLEAIWLVWIRRDYAAAFTWITVRGGGVTLVASGRRNFPLDHRAAPHVHVDHGGCAAKLR